MNLNPLIMTQPELGRKIAGLRKEKGLTQEELVEKCNLNVRTIQRIEAGEVMPRSYTVKTILGALEYDFDKMRSDFSGFEEQANYPPEAKKIFNFALYMGIVFFILGFIEILMDWDLESGKSFAISGAWYTIIKSACLISMLFFYKGFAYAGTLFNNYLLKVSSILMIAIYGVSYTLDIVLRFVETDYEDYFTVAFLILISCAMVLNGIGMLRLKQYFSINLTAASGFLTIISGATLFLFVGVILLIPATIVQLILLYRMMEFEKTIHDD